MGVIAWLTGSTLGRWAAILALGVGFIWFVFRIGVSSGSDKIRMKQTADSLANAMKRVAENAQVTKMSRDQRRNALDSWMRD